MLILTLLFHRAAHFSPKAAFTPTMYDLIAYRGCNRTPILAYYGELNQLIIMYQILHRIIFIKPNDTVSYLALRSILSNYCYFNFFIRASKLTSKDLHTLTHKCTNRVLSNVSRMHPCNCQNHVKLRIISNDLFLRM